MIPFGYRGANTPTRFWDQGSTGLGEYEVLHDLFGRRVWVIDDNGWLTGTYFHARWTEGVNEAVCLQSRTTDQFKEPSRTAGAFGVKYDENGKGYFAEGYEHVTGCPGVARGDHGCGFFIRYQGYPWTMSEPGIEGVVQVWGRVEAGKKGLRAEFARIVALTEPHLEPKDQEYLTIQRQHIARIRNTIATTSGILDTSLQQSLNTKLKIIDRVTRAVRLWPMVLEHYPNTPIYPNREAMFAEHPCPDPTWLWED